MENIELTVFTPTYNRAYKLPQLYESLCKQTSNNFEWLIVDDGSTDDTEFVVRRWIDENVIKIRYYKQENGGKQRAHNLGVQKSLGLLFVCVDSDDYVEPEFVRKHLEQLPRLRQNTKLAGIISLQGYSNSKPVGTYFPKGIKYTTLSNLYNKKKYKGDSTLAYYTAVLKQYPFVVEDGEKFIGEAYVYNQIDQKYELLVLPEILTIKEYLEDGYTKNVRKLTKDNPKSYVRLKKQSIEYSKTWKDRYIQTILYMVGCRMSHQSQVKNAPYKFLAVTAYFPAWIAWKLFYERA